MEENIPDGQPIIITLFTNSNWDPGGPDPEHFPVENDVSELHFA